MIYIQTPGMGSNMTNEIYYQEMQNSPNHQANKECYQIPVYYVISSLSFHHYSSARNTKSSGRYLDNWPTNGSLQPYTHLEDIQSDKYLGVVLDNRISFNKHTDEISKKATNLLNLCRRNLHMCHENIKETAYKAALNIKLLEPLAQGASRFEKSLAPPKIHWPPIFFKRRKKPSST